MLGKSKEIVAEIGQVKGCDIVVDQIRHVEPYFIEAKSFTTPVPREGAQEGI